MEFYFFVQIQLLIQQKAIGSITKKEENKKGERQETEKGTTPRKGENDLIEKICKNCNQVFYTGNVKKETCSYPLQIEWKAFTFNSMSFFL